MSQYLLVYLCVRTSEMDQNQTKTDLGTPLPKHNVWSELLQSILSHQFVGSGILPGVIFQCTTGSGIGLNMSADFCDLAFAELVEKSTVLSPEFRNKHGIAFYGRYRDDIFILFKHSNQSIVDEVFFALNAKAEGL